MVAAVEAGAPTLRRNPRNLSSDVQQVRQEKPVSDLRKEESEGMALGPTMLRFQGSEAGLDLTLRSVTKRCNPMSELILRPLARRGRSLWRRLPKQVLSSWPMQRLGEVVYERYIRRSNPYQSHSTHFMRNVPQMELVRDLVSMRHSSADPLRIASVGCSTGAELYSFLWVIRSALPNIQVKAHGVDISPEVVDVARRAVYRPDVPAAEGGLYLAGQPDLFSEEVNSMTDILEPFGVNELRVREWLREDVEWSSHDATDDRLLAVTGLQDVVVANNFMGPMEDELAERCLRNVARLVRPGGILVVDGVDLGVKAKVMASLRYTPILERVEEIHFADPTKQDWPWTRWSHGPIDRQRTDWRFRYSTVFHSPASPS